MKTQLNEYPENMAVETGEFGNCTYSIVYNRGYHCGYVRFPRKVLKSEGYFGILSYAQVHGRITYAVESKDGSMVYGFDCAHARDRENPLLKNREWLRHECRLMAASVRVAAWFENEYLNGNQRDAVSKYITAMRGIESAVRMRQARDIEENERISNGTVL